MSIIFQFSSLGGVILQIKPEVLVVFGDPTTLWRLEMHYSNGFGQELRTTTVVLHCQSPRTCDSYLGIICSMLKEKHKFTTFDHTHPQFFFVQIWCDPTNCGVCSQDKWWQSDGICWNFCRLVDVDSHNGSLSSWLILDSLQKIVNSFNVYHNIHIHIIYM